MSHWWHLLLLTALLAAALFMRTTLDNEPPLIVVVHAVIFPAARSPLQYDSGIRNTIVIGGLAGLFRVC